MYSAMSFRASPTSLSARPSSVVASAGTIFMTWFTITAAAAASSSPTELESSIAAFRSVLSASF